MPCHLCLFDTLPTGVTWNGLWHCASKERLVKVCVLRHGVHQFAVASFCTTLFQPAAKPNTEVIFNARISGSDLRINLATLLIYHCEFPFPTRHFCPCHTGYSKTRTFILETVDIYDCARSVGGGRGGWGYAVELLVEALRYKPEGRRLDSLWGSSRFFINLILSVTIWPWARNRNEYQKYLLRGKYGRCVGLTTLPPSCSDYLKILGISTSWSPRGLSRDVQEQFYLS